MRHITIDELHIRIDDIFRNLTTINCEGKISLRPISKESEYWMIMWTHILEELNIRGCGPPQNNILSPETIPQPTFPEHHKGAKLSEEIKFKEGECLFKFGKKKYMKPLYDDGELRIAPATHYKDSSLNSAINDDERILSIYHMPENLKFTYVDKNTGEAREIKPIGNVESKYELRTDYYVFCASYVHDPRLYDDFEADSCIVIHKPEIFLNLIDREFDKLLRGWVFYVGQVEYIDPLNPPNEKELNLFFGKHFRYAYQREIRAVWVPPEVEELLEPIEINIGSMREYADYFEIQS